VPDSSPTSSRIIGVGFFFQRTPGVAERVAKLGPIKQRDGEDEGAASADRQETNVSLDNIHGDLREQSFLEDIQRVHLRLVGRMETGGERVSADSTNRAVGCSANPVDRVQASHEPHEMTDRLPVRTQRTTPRPAAPCVKSPVSSGKKMIRERAGGDQE
jgi:hypothetical protein